MGIAILGALRVDGGQALPARRDRVVLAALALHPGETVTADRLADALWGEDPPASATKIVQGCVVRLRKLLGPGAIETTAGGYRLTVPRDDIDAHRFAGEVGRARDLLASGQAERAVAVLDGCLPLWRGEPLADLAGWDTAQIEAGRLAELHLEAEELYVEAVLASGETHRVVATAQALVDEAPLREHRWALLALAQYRAGRQGDALATLRRLRQVLDRDLGIAPGPEVTALEGAILRQEPSLGATSPAPDPDPVCPYPGLAPYDVDSTAGFFGRDRDVAACLHRLRDEGVLVVAGPSGCGKSSLVRAGVAGALVHDGQPVEVLTPGTHPMAALAERPRHHGATLVVDQAEELFALCPDVRERERFCAALAAHAEDGHLVLALRADRLADAAAHPDLARLVERGLYLLGAMDEDGLREAVEGPARRAGLLLESGLVDLLVAEVDERPGALPLLSHALRQTWERREGRTLTVAGYRASGGIRGAVAQSAEEVYAELDEPGRAVLRELLLRMVSLGDNGSVVRSPLPRRVLESQPDYAPVLELLVEHRLVTSDGDAVELAHEVLARAWPRLRAWLDEDVEGQRIRHHLAPAADAWEGLGRPASELYRGVRLGTVLDWRRRTGASLTAVERAFLDAGERAADAERDLAVREARRHQRVNRRLRGLLAVGGVLLLLTVLAGANAARQTRRAVAAGRVADRAAVEADAGRLGARALTAGDISLSLLLAVEGVNLGRSPQARANLVAALVRRPQLLLSGSGAGTHFGALDGSRDRWLLATSDGTNRVALYDRALTRLGAVAVGPRHQDGYDVSVAFSPDGRTLAVGQDVADGTPVTLVDPATEHLLPVQPGGLPDAWARVQDLRFSGDGRHLAATLAPTAGSPYALVWDLRRLRHPHRVRLPLGDQGLALNRDGSVLYTSWPLAAYDARTGARLWRSPWHGRRRLALNPAGTLLALPEWDGRRNNDVLVVSTRDGRLVRRLPGRREQAGAVRFSGDGRTLATVSGDGSVLLWDTRTWTVGTELDSGQVNGLSFSPDSTKLATSGDDAALRVWDLSGEKRYVPQVGAGRTLPATAGSIVASPYGRTLAYLWLQPVRHRARLSFYDVAADRSGPALDAGRASTAPLGAWSPDQRWLVTATDDGTVRVWDPVRGRLVARRRVAAGPVTHLVFTADGSRLVLSDGHGRVLVLDARTLAPVGSPVQLDGPACCVTVGPGATASVFTDPAGVHEDGAAASYTRWNRVDLDTGTVLRSRRLGVAVRDAATSPDGRRVAVTGSGGAMWLLDATTGLPVRRPYSDRDADGVLATFSPDGARVLTTTSDGTVSLWNGRSGALLGTVDLGERSPLTAQFLYPDEIVLLAFDHGGVFEWDTSEQHAVQAACRLAGRTMTRAEWARFLGDRPFRVVCRVLDQPINENFVDPGGLLPSR